LVISNIVCTFVKKLDIYMKIHITMKHSTLVDNNLKLTEKVFYSFIEEIIYQNGEFKLSNKEISDILQISERTVTRKIKKLVSLGYITSTIKNINFINQRTIIVFPKQLTHIDIIDDVTNNEVDNINVNSDVDINDVKEILPKVNKMKKMLGNFQKLKVAISNDFEKHLDEHMPDHIKETKYDLLNSINKFKQKYGYQSSTDVLNKVIEISMTDKFLTSI
jgi:DNA-binding CsgD family transcriptional regulator